MEDYNFDALSDYEKELAQGYIECGELNLKIVEEDEYASEEGLYLGELYVRGSYETQVG